MAAKKKNLNLPGGVPVGGLFDARPVEKEAVRAERRTLPERVVAIMEFRGGDGRDWRVERWEEFCAETYPVGAQRGDWTVQIEAALPSLHASLLLKENARQWLIVRRLFGFMPVRVGLNEDPEQWRTWSPAELCQELGINAEQFQQEMKVLRAGVAKCVGSNFEQEATERTERKNLLPSVATELIETDTDLLTKYGYSASMFDAQMAFRVTMEGRDTWEYRAREKAENAIEMKWFCGRLRDLEKLMPLAMTAQLARSALMHELRMRRAQTDLFRYGPGSPEYERARAEYDKAESSHRETIGQIDEVAPWFNVSGKEAGLTASMGDVVKAMQQWHARGDKKLIDGLFTAAGIQVLLRTSRQFEDPRYRLGWNLYVMDSRRGIFDPNWKSQLKERDLKKLDRGFKDGVLAVMEEEGEEAIDLVKDEYSDLGPDGPEAPPKEDDETVESESSEAGEGEPENVVGETVQREEGA